MYRRTRAAGFGRRALLCGAAMGAVSAASGATGTSGRGGRVRPRVAAVITECRFRSHAHVILENFVEPYLFNGVLHEPGVRLVSIYEDQVHPGDLAREIAVRYGIRIYPTIAGALCLGGGELAVDAVLSIGEHGRYPVNEKGVREYPRKRIFDEIAAVVLSSGRRVPVFNDKHYSFRWDWAREMVETAGELGMPLMAGSSVPLAERRPPLELPVGMPLREAVAVHGGGFEGYDFHALEVLQSMVESRAGEETGVAAVQLLRGEGLLEAARAGRWSLAPGEAALRVLPGAPASLERLLGRPAGGRRSPWGILVEYVDGLRAVVLRVAPDETHWSFACSVAGEAAPRVTRFHVGPWRHRCLFMALSHAIQSFFREGRAPYPPERTLLTTGILAAAVDSRFEGGSRRTTPHLGIRYVARDFRAFREHGSSWRLLPEDEPEPRGVRRLGPEGRPAG